LANALPKNQLIAAQQPNGGVLTKGGDVMKSAATAAAAAAAISHMSDKIDGTSSEDKAQGSLQDIVSPVSTIVKKHDKTQIAKLKQTGKISEGFPDMAFVHIPQTGGDAIAMASTPIFPYGFGLRANLALNLMVDKKKQGNNFCYFEQLPPKEITKLYSKKVFEEAYSKRTVFCTVRNPYDRIVAEYHNCRENGMKGNGRCEKECSVIHLNNFVQRELSAFQKGDYLRDECQLIPQTDYMSGEGGCSKILNYDHIERDFNELMESHGYNLTLAHKESKSILGTSCDQQVTKANLTATSRKLIEKVYEKDFSTLGAEFGWIEESPMDKVSKFLMGPIRALTSTYAQIGETEETLFADLPQPEEGHKD